MSSYETYQSNAAQVPIMRKWLLCALVISLLLHAALIFFFAYKRLENFGYSSEARLAPPVHVMRQVKIPDIQDQDTKLVLPEKVPRKPIALAKDSPTVDEVRVMPTALDVTAPLVQEKPKVDLGGFEALDKSPGNSMAAMEKQLMGLAGGQLDRSRSINQPVIKVPISTKGGEGGAGTGGGIPGRATLDEALGKAGGPIANKAIAVRGGALFEWGKAELRPESIQDLQKLGELIKRNPKATFIISGHTDHTGAHDTNLILSQQRADAVRDWLVTNLSIDPLRITTIGRADDEAFPDLGPDKSIEEQAPNRRVEIVIRTRGK